MTDITWQDLPQFPRASDETDINWVYLERTLDFYKTLGVNLDPDYQREHVWSESQRCAWLEYVLSGGEVGRTLIFATSSWHSPNYKDPAYFFTLVDGKQRLETVRSFLRGELRIFGGKALLDGRRVPEEGLRYQDFGGHFRGLLYGFKFRVVGTPRRLDVLNLYLQLNAGGTPHSGAELARVTALRDAEIERMTATP